MSTWWRLTCALLAAVVGVCLDGRPAAPQPGSSARQPGERPPPAQVAAAAVQTPLVTSLQQALGRGHFQACTALVSPAVDKAGIENYLRWMLAGEPVTRVVLRERDRVPVTGTGGVAHERLAIDALVERGSEAIIHSWSLDTAAGAILDLKPLSVIDGLARLALDGASQYATRGLVVRGEDVEFRLPEGHVFVARTGGLITAAVLIGDGELVFRPSDPVERGQVRIFAGSETLQTPFDAAYVRLPASDADRLLPADALTAEPVDRRLFERASAVFRAQAEKSYLIDLGDLSAERWWVQPQPGDLVADVRTKKYGTLTYARSWKDPEDVTLFDRLRRRHIAIYASPAKIAERGRFFDESDGRDYEVTRYDIDASIAPDRQWIEGRTRLRVKVLEDGLARLTLRLADSLAVQSVATAQHGRVLGLRVRGHNSLLVNLPTPSAKGSFLDITVAYKGRVTPQSADRESIQFPNAPVVSRGDDQPVPIEASYLYSNRSYWYAQSTEPSYATATIRLHVPADYTCVGSGELAGGAPLTMGVVKQDGPSEAQRIFVFDASHPVRYLAVVISRFTRLDAEKVPVGQPDGPGVNPDSPDGPADCGSLLLAAEVARRFKSDGQKLMAAAAEMAKFYAGLAGGCPYPSFTLALVEHELPGGHSPAYFAVLQQVSRAGRSAWNWMNDPAAFPGFPEYFLAHELAHQWWGQAVGTRNYHEQWVSEGFAQYFAALYAERARGPEAYRAVIRQFRRSTVDHSSEGPIYLGARIGHIRGDSRLFRALVYNKGGLVLHMLRQLLGDQTFFRGLRRFYRDYRFRKAGTDEVRRSFEAESGRSLERFFDGWVYGQALPELTLTAITDAATGEVTLRIEQGSTLFDVPVPVALELSDGSTLTVIVPLSDRVTEHRVQIPRTLRRASIVREDLAATVRGG